MMKGLDELKKYIRRRKKYLTKINQSPHSNNSEIIFSANKLQAYNEMESEIKKLEKERSDESKHLKDRG